MDDRPWLSSYDPDVDRSLNHTSRSVQDILDGAVSRYADRRVLDFFGYTMTYRQLSRAVDRFAASLAALGLKRGDRVVLLLPNCPHFIVAFFASMKIGAVVVPTNPLYSEKELAFQIKDSGAQTLITLDLLYAGVCRVRQQTGLRSVIAGRIQDFLPLLKKLLYPLRAQKEAAAAPVAETDGVVPFSKMLRERHPAAPDPGLGSSDLAMLQYTGGTTGVAKGAMLTHGNIVANHQQMYAWYKGMQQGTEVFISVLPFFHSYGMATTMSLPFALGATLIIFPKFVARDILKAIQKHKATVLPGIPSIYSVLSSMKDISRYDISSINYCISGAAPLPVKVLEDFERMTGGIIMEGYGLTEASPVTHCNPLKGQRKVGSIGLPVPDTECKIVDIRTGTDLPPGETGELCIRGPQVMKGYWNNEEETRMALRDGWLYTGDIARMDAQGYFYIAERKKDMIISEGFNIYPREIEEFLLGHPAVQDAAVIGMPDKLRGERVIAHVVLKQGAAATQDDLLRYCREHLVKYKIPRKFIFTDSIPTNIAGKKLRRVLRDGGQGAS